MDERAVATSYDAVADDYAREIGGELAHKPLDRALLAAVVELAGGGRIADLGCGPGHVAAHLADLGAEVAGLDLSAEMVRVARERVPGVEFVQGDLRRLPFADGTFACAVAFYSLIHLPPEDVGGAVGEVARVLAPGGHALVAFHRGEEVRHLDTWWGHDVDLDFHLMDPEVVLAHMKAAGLERIARLDRAPIPEAETQTERCYLLARRSAGAPPRGS